MKGSIRAAKERDRSGMCEEARRLFIYLSTRTRLRSGEQIKFRVNLPHSWPGVESNRVPACIFRAIDHPERLPSPGDHSPQSAANPSAVHRPRPFVACSLLSLFFPFSLSFSLSLIHSKTPVHFPNFPNSFANRGERNAAAWRDTHTRATSNYIRFEIGYVRMRVLVDSFCIDRATLFYNFVK